MSQASENAKNKKATLQPGRATRAGTERYAARFSDRPGHFRSPDQLSISSIGLGTRQGDVGGVDDLLYRSALPLLFESGCNLINTALLVGGEAMRVAAEKILDTLGAGPLIFNLGHGVLPATPPDHVAELVALVRAWNGS